MRRLVCHGVPIGRLSRSALSCIRARSTAERARARTHVRGGRLRDERISSLWAGRKRSVLTLPVRRLFCRSYPINRSDGNLTLAPALPLPFPSFCYSCCSPYLPRRPQRTPHARPPRHTAILRYLGTTGTPEHERASFETWRTASHHPAHWKYTHTHTGYGARRSTRRKDGYTRTDVKAPKILWLLWPHARAKVRRGTGPVRHDTRRTSRSSAFPRGRSLSRALTYGERIQRAIYLARAISRRSVWEREREGEIDATRRDATTIQPTCAADCGRLSVETRPRCALAIGALLAADGDPSGGAPLTVLRAPIRVANWSTCDRRECT